MRPYSVSLLLAYLSAIGCDHGTKVKETSHGRRDAVPPVNVHNVESVRMVFHSEDRDERQEKQKRYLIHMKDKVFPAYEAILNDPRSGPDELSGVLSILLDVKVDRHRFAKHALSRLRDENIVVRIFALHLLEQIGSPMEAPAVVDLLSADQMEVVYAAAKTLASIGDRHELKSMDEWLRGDNHRNDAELRQHVQNCRNRLKKRLDEHPTE